MVSKSCLIVACFIKYIAALTNLDDEVVALGGNRGDWWYDDFVYVANGGYADTIPFGGANAWYNGGDADARLNNTVTCSICEADPEQSPTRKIHGWFQDTLAGR